LPSEIGWWFVAENRQAARRTMARYQGANTPTAAVRLWLIAWILAWIVE
jgi:hypothetical protein